MKTKTEKIPAGRKFVEFSIAALEDNMPVQGNAIASGDDTQDSEVENDILRRLDDGDVWAWATVKVTAKYGEVEGVDYLGCCSYQSEGDFIENSGYYEDMKAVALARLEEKLEQAGKAARKYFQRAL